MGVTVFQESISADDIKAKARDLGADLVGIANSAEINANPADPADPRIPANISDYDADRVIILAKRLSAGVTRIPRWDERHKYYNDELTMTTLEEIGLELVLWLETKGYPALIVPPTHVDPWRYQGDPDAHMKPLLPLDHCAVEAGMGTLGLNLQLLTPEYGPRVMLAGVLCSAPVDSGQLMEKALCKGPECGRCLRTCPGDVVGHWERDWAACDKFRAPHGFHHLTDFMDRMLDAEPAQQKTMLRSEDTFDLWQSILRGAGAITGCRRCQDVCPVGEDYQRLIGNSLDEMPEDSADKQAKATGFAKAEAAGELPESYRQQARWIGELA